MPQLNANNLKFPSRFLTQRLIPESLTGATNTLLKGVIEPEAISSITAANTQEVGFAEDHVIVDTRVRERLEADAMVIGRGGRTTITSCCWW